MGNKKLFPFQNTSLVNLPHEVWKDIPNFEGIYQISQYGRVKSLPRKVNMGSGKWRVCEEMIRRPLLNKYFNKTVKERRCGLIITLFKDGTQYNYSIARLVYFIFGEKFNYADRSILISYKNGDTRNVHISNLVQSNIKALRQSSIAKGRSVNSLRMPVTQFDLQGNPINFFSSSYEVEKKLSIDSSNLTQVAAGKNGYLRGGFFWKLGKHDGKLDVSKLVRISARETINSKLSKQLKLKNIDANNPPALINLSLESMKGEVWKPVPGYKEYMVSNIGRIKALPKILNRKLTRFFPEQILRLNVTFREDAKGKKIPGYTFVYLYKNGRSKNFQVARLVYYSFVKNYDISNPRLRVHYKDRNRLNLHYKNLILKNRDDLHS